MKLFDFRNTYIYTITLYFLEWYQNRERKKFNARSDNEKRKS